MTYSLTKRAEADIIDIYQFGVEKFGAPQAERYNEKLYAVFDLIGRNPLIAPERKDALSSFRIHAHGAHAILYRVERNRVLIVRVLGAHQDWLRHI